MGKQTTSLERSASVNLTPWSPLNAVEHLESIVVNFVRCNPIGSSFLFIWPISELEPHFEAA